MAASDDSEGGCGVEVVNPRNCGYVSSAGVDDINVFLAFFSRCVKSGKSVLGMKGYGYAFRKVVRNHSRETDSKIYNVSVF